MTVIIERDGKDVADIITRIHASFTGAAARAVLRAAELAAGHLRETIMEFSRTGALARSTRTELVVDSTDVAARAFPDSIYARVQDEGETIKPVNVTKLAIPLSDANIPLGKAPRDFGKDELVLTMRGKKVFLGKPKEKGKDQELLYVLKDQATIPPKNYIEDAAERAEDDVVAELASFTEEIVKKELE